MGAQAIKKISPARRALSAVESARHTLIRALRDMDEADKALQDFSSAYMHPPTDLPEDLVPFWGEAAKTLRRALIQSSKAEFALNRLRRLTLPALVVGQDEVGE